MENWCSRKKRPLGDLVCTQLLQTGEVISVQWNWFQKNKRSATFQEGMAHIWQTTIGFGFVWKACRLAWDNDPQRSLRV